ncbi:hypothetical protein T4A_12402 [Trichinella pseudospiralis]|uniref:Uncharacterized protein n=1 Tax=Trichinella pseudospiralis TaxID=6337 RepID=A0A0V1EJE6_TRIPS|nr:hypothetical protein T4A_12402 [Trichinella pseudospiralis]
MTITRADNEWQKKQFSRQNIRKTTNQSRMKNCKKRLKTNYRGSVTLSDSVINNLLNEFFLWKKTNTDNDDDDDDDDYCNAKQQKMRKR